jgi:hypothetical protein
LLSLVARAAGSQLMGLPRRTAGNARNQRHAPRPRAVQCRRSPNAPTVESGRNSSWLSAWNGLDAKVTALSRKSAWLQTVRLAVSSSSLPKMTLPRRRRSLHRCRTHGAGGPSPHSCPVLGPIRAGAAVRQVRAVAGGAIVMEPIPLKCPPASRRSGFQVTRRCGGRATIRIRGFLSRLAAIHPGPLHSAFARWPPSNA